jgi:hypothetical protein
MMDSVLHAIYLVEKKYALDLMTIHRIPSSIYQLDYRRTPVKYVRAQRDEDTHLSDFVRVIQRSYELRYNEKVKLIDDFITLRPFREPIQE